MTLLEATRVLLEAVRAGDLAAVESALGARAAALVAGELATPEIAEMGEQALRGLRQLQIQLRSEAAGVERLERALGHTVVDPNVDVRG